MVRLWLLAGMASWGCQTEQRVVGVKGGFSGLARLPGAQSQLPPEALPPAEPSDRWSRLLPQDEPGEPVEGRPLRRVLPTGDVVLLSRSPRELIVHLYETLRDEEYELLEKQVLSERTRSAYRREGKPVGEAVRWLIRNRDEIEKLISAMPVGDQTPGVLMNPLGNNAFRLSVQGGEMLPMRYHTLDVVIEEGRFRLLMIR